MIKIIFFIFIFNLSVFAGDYPSHWWKIVPENQRQANWEILPHEAKKGEVILSKRNELGVFSNFAHTPIQFEGDTYASIEALWQMMKYPEPKLKDDPRKLTKGYPYTRDQVKKLHGFEAKKAGDIANVLNRNIGIDWVSYKGQKFNYKDFDIGSKLHYRIMFNAIKAKVDQHPKVKELLIKTKGLILRPDHQQGERVPPSYEYFKILMDIRSQI